MTARTRKPKHGGRRKGAGRPPSPATFSVRLVVRLDPALLAHAEWCAEAAGLSVADYVRALLAGRATPAATAAANRGGTK